MIDAIWSDIPLQIVMVAIATVFAAWAVWHQGSSRQLRFTIAMLQALVFESSLVLLASAAFPNLFQSLLNRQGLIAMVAMMTLIYSTRDLFENIQSWRSPHKGDLPGNRKP